MTRAGAALYRDGHRRGGDPRAARPVAGLRPGGASGGAATRRRRPGRTGAWRCGWRRPYGYDEINLNCGCPSDRVQSGCFGAVLMETPGAGGRLRRRDGGRQPGRGDGEMPDRRRRSGPRAGAAGFPRGGARRPGCGGSRSMPARPGCRACRRSRTARCRRWTMGWCCRMKAAFPELHISLNGGVTSAGAGAGAAGRRARRGDAWPRRLSRSGRRCSGPADARIFGEWRDAATAKRWSRAMLPYIEAHLAAGGRLHQITRHMLGLFTGRPGARRGGGCWRGRHRSPARKALEAAAAQVLAAA